MADFKTLHDAPFAGKRVLVRVDLNVPVENGVVSDTTRIERVVPTIRTIADKGGKVILLAHFGRPKAGPDEANSLNFLTTYLADHLGHPVAFAPHGIEASARAIAAMKPGDVLLLENTRFHTGEENNDPDFVTALAALGDVYVNDAFSAAHRAHATTEGLARKLPAYAGHSMTAELEALSKALDRPDRPVAAIVGGAKVSTKLELLGNLVKKVDILIIGGGMANTFLAAQGKAVGKSLCEHDLLDTARTILAEAGACEIVLPVDAVVAKEFKANAPSRAVSVDAVEADDMMLDMGPTSIENVASILRRTKTLVWNGPFGAFELKPFDAGTMAIAQQAAAMTKAGDLVTIAGGGDTVSALNAAGVAAEFTYISTAGGAFLEWLEGKTLPGVHALRNH
ncbi:phosphoglycerate kinase [Lichenihabitans sp. PAMC28606]|uniref:phosphoglycerate kinase n=1 Tax=Lichenihabitans sp. PAMC28606 TaxID=2880932 RepID=UPI001D0B3950|nr:phosphoglycerate kinase [Lichenihabitans sp. PAMC28606]UDL93233.1 phosphoglycerate kinase [Lichenihabitans sp. PAMC28606]